MPTAPAPPRKRLPPPPRGRLPPPPRPPGPPAPPPRPPPPRGVRIWTTVTSLPFWALPADSLGLGGGPPLRTLSRRSGIINPTLVEMERVVLGLHAVFRENGEGDKWAGWYES